MEKYIVEVVDGKIVSEPVRYIASESSTWVEYVVNGAWIVGVIFVLFLSLFVVKQQSLYIIERFGKFLRIAKSGLRFKIPFVDRVAGELSLKIDELKEDIGVKAKDNSFLVVPVKVQYRVIEDKAYEAFYALENPKGQIVSYVVNTVRSTATTMSMEEIFSGKDAFEIAVESSLKEKFSALGYEIINVLVDDPQPSKEVVGAFNRVIASQREKEASINEAESKRILLVGVANAEAQSLEIKAKAYVQQRKTIADGLADATEELKKTGLNTKEVLSYLEGIDWRDTIRDASSHGKAIIIPADMNRAFVDTVSALEVR